MLAPPQPSKREATPKLAANPPPSGLPALTPTDLGVACQLATGAPRADSASERAAGAAAQTVVGGGADRASTEAPFGVVVDDESPAGPGQRHRAEFMTDLGREIERVAAEELQATGRSVQNCPYLRYWLDLYRDRPATQIERAIRRYARPERTDLQSLRMAVLDRVRTATQAWLRSGGRDLQVPQGVSPLGPPVQTARPGGDKTIQRKAEPGSGPLPPATYRVAVRAQLGAGQPLDLGVRTRMERGFGRSFGDVRLHADARAAQLSGAFSARAFTVGSDVAFGAGEYRPGTLPGDLLIAHELAHTVQQRRTATCSESGLEADADGAAVRFIQPSGRRFSDEGRANGRPIRGAGVRGRPDDAP